MYICIKYGSQQSISQFTKSNTRFLSYKLIIIDLSNIGEAITSLSMSFLFYYLGYYILASEITQLVHEGWRQYISVYNFFDLASVIMPLVTYTCITLIKSTEESLTQRLTIAIAFTVLVMWIELVNMNS